MNVVYVVLPWIQLKRWVISAKVVIYFFFLKSEIFTSISSARHDFSWVFGVQIKIIMLSLADCFFVGFRDNYT